MTSQKVSPLVKLLMIQKIAVAILLLLLAPGMAFAMGAPCPPHCGGSGGSGGSGGTGGSGGGGTGGGPPVDYDVIIVGAGAAGLYAAYELDNLGFNIKVLEGRPRHGGRIWHQNDRLGTTSLDEFAEVLTGNKNWHYDDVRDIDKNRLVEIFKKTANDDLLFSIGGTTILATDATKKGNPEIYDYWDFYYDDGYQGVDIDFESYLCNRLSVCRGDNDFHFYVQGWPGGKMSTRLDTIGARSLVIQEDLWTLGTRKYGFATSTWLDTLDELYFSQILEKVQFDTDVTAIDWNREIPSGGEYPVISDAVWVTDERDDEYTANAVLVTAPLGVLRDGGISFVSGLSNAKKFAIDNMGFGNGGKMFLQFSNRFWPATTTAFHTEGGHCGFAWDQSYKGGEGNTVVVCYSVGEVAENLDALPDDNARIAAALSDLDNMYDGTPFSDAFVDGYWKRTDQMSHAHGTYSFPTIGTYLATGEPSLRELLAAPEGAKIYFAGEATSNDHPATVIGAMESGMRAAGEIDADHDPQ